MACTGRAEAMDAFFDARADGYDDHMRANVAGFDAFYRAAARAIETSSPVESILDLGIGTGLELAAVFERIPQAQVTGIDLSQGMIDQLQQRYADRSAQIRLIHGSFFDIDLGTAEYDATISVMALHHWLPEVKIELYRRIRLALHPGGVFVNADYIVDGDEALRLRTQHPDAGAFDREGLRHIDIPCSADEEREILLRAGFSRVKVSFATDRSAVIAARS